ncbi:uncharacterized protein TRAVEDRAFT_49335 [Trametes versicolor FP-101664 SS1]|uniref:uncharacterized protein n=1 Tax=Trametes versicolor (strain FP-101664) TaxID=717944 RepID=UPI0004624197|nr:uncharacterized protein TRAVEDRAFT_49335 [Trametes versicolor FP-101664 SS1]EIW56508.1 hypothetical protein TRAVEDRAFT_49335 [Trametes versicolor FP-101664 SS1]
MNANVVFAPPCDSSFVQVSAYARAGGLDNLPDTYYISSFVLHTGKIGVGDRLLMFVLDRSDDSVLSRYLVTLKTIRLRGAEVTEFRGECLQLPLNLVYIQAPTSRSRISRLALWDLMRGRLTLTDPIPPWRDLAIKAIRMPLPIPVGIKGHPPRIEVRVSVESRMTDE